MELNNSFILFGILVSLIVFLVLYFRNEISNMTQDYLDITKKFFNISAYYDNGELNVVIEEEEKGEEDSRRDEKEVIGHDVEEPSDVASFDIKPQRVPAPVCGVDGQCNTYDPMKGTEEVFIVEDNKFTYADAEPLCKAYGAKLATLEQVEDAYKNGADWCNYGWIEGEMAVFPTQPNTYYKLQESKNPRVRNKCGRIGINGGSFPKERKFGVHCYGPKPAVFREYKNKCNLRQPLTPEEIEERTKQNHYREKLGQYQVMPFNKQYWAENY